MLSAIDGVGPDELNLSSLFKRLNKNNVSEIILATNATVEGQITAQYIADNCPKKTLLLLDLLKEFIRWRTRNFRL